MPTKASHHKPARHDRRHEDSGLGTPPERVRQAAVECLIASDLLHLTRDLDEKEGQAIAQWVGNAQEMALYILQNEIESLWNGEAIPARPTRTHGSRAASNK